MATVLICMRPHLQHIVGLDELHQIIKEMYIVIVVSYRSDLAKLHDRLPVVMLRLLWPVRSAAIQARSSSSLTSTAADAAPMNEIGRWSS